MTQYVAYYYRGMQENTTRKRLVPVYSRKNEFPWKNRRECQIEAIRDGKRAVFIKNIPSNESNNRRAPDSEPWGTAPGLIRRETDK